MQYDTTHVKTSAHKNTHFSLVTKIGKCFGLFVCWDWGFKLMGSLLQSRSSTAGALLPVHFALVILEIGSHTFSAWDQPSK
jgi:hypothetical protein